MRRILLQAAAVAVTTWYFTPMPARATLDGAVEVVISVADQRMAILCDGGLVDRFPISTSRYGEGDRMGSYRTPVGRLKVCDKIGGELPAGSVIKHRSATGEVLAANAPGRDPIVSRILWLDGLEEENRNARARGIYIHGTTEERQLGKPVSYGCIRMRSADVIELYDELPVGAAVTILPEKLPHYPKYVPHPPPPPAPPQEIIAKHTPEPSSPAAAASPSAPTTAAPQKTVAASKPAHSGTTTVPPVSAIPTNTATLPSHALPAPIAALGVSKELETPRKLTYESLPKESGAQYSGSNPRISLKGSILFSGLSAPREEAKEATPRPSAQPETKSEETKAQAAPEKHEQSG